MVAPERLELSFSTPITIKWIEAILGYEANKIIDYEIARKQLPTCRNEYTIRNAYRQTQSYRK